MRLERQPRLAGTLGGAFHVAQHPLGSRALSAHGCQRHAALADAEEGPKVAVMRPIDDNALPELVVRDPLARSERNVGKLSGFDHYAAPARASRRVSHPEKWGQAAWIVGMPIFPSIVDPSDVSL